MDIFASLIITMLSILMDNQVICRIVMKKTLTKPKNDQILYRSSGVSSLTEVCTKSRFPVFLSAKTYGKMVVILKKEFTAMLSLESRIMVNYINIVSGKAQFLSGKITFLPLKTIKEKIACYLMQRTSKDVGKEVTIDITQTNLADPFWCKPAFPYPYHP